MWSAAADCLHRTAVTQKKEVSLRLGFISVHSQEKTSMFAVLSSQNLLCKDANRLHAVFAQSLNFRFSNEVSAHYTQQFSCTCRKSLVGHILHF